MEAELVSLISFLSVIIIYKLNGSTSKMFLDLNCNQHIVFKDLEFTLKLAEAFKLLTVESDFLCFGSYVPTNDFLDLIGRFSAPEAVNINNLNCFFDNYREEYPTGGAYYARAKKKFINKIVAYCKNHEDEIPFDHVVGFSSTSPKFSFHDAMSGGDLRLPENLDKRVVDQLATILKSEPHYEKMW